MNPVAVVHLIAGVVAIVVSLPLIQGRVKMNGSYGIRIRQAFESEQRWYAINRYGGQLLLRWGVALVVVALCGMAVPKQSWWVYSIVALLPVCGGLAWVIALIYRYARAT